MAGNYRSPVLAGRELEDVQRLWSDEGPYFMEYSTNGMEMDTQMQTPSGPVLVSAIGGEGSGRISAANGTVASAGSSKDIVYNVSVAGLPPMKVSLDEISATMGMPLDNVEDVKAATIQMKMDGLDLDPNIWAMFDAKGVLPRDKANLEIDLSANLKWAQKLADMNMGSAMGQLPISVTDAEITAVNLTALGAELKTNGAFDINSKAFPPTANGTVDVSLKGANGLLTKLSEAGLLPVQNAMAAKGMMGLFFKQGGEGSDHLTSQIVVSPDGSISANGFPLK